MYIYIYIYIYTYIYIHIYIRNFDENRRIYFLTKEEKVFNEDMEI